MEIKNIILHNFRNYSQLNFNPDSGINVLYGANAQGKTNLIESVYLCCVGKSMRGKDRELIMSGSERAQVKVIAKKKLSGNLSVDIRLFKSLKKSILINGIPILKMGELMGGINCIYFSPDELCLIKDAPECRRKFLDIDISQINKRYFYTLLDYSKILSQRNNILKNKDKQFFAMLDVYDTQLSRAGAYIHRCRMEFLQGLTPMAKQIHSYITKGESLEIKYQPYGKYNSDDIEKSLLQSLKDNIQKDTILGYTTTGPHRDDIKISVDNIDVRVYGSQGQQRTCALSLKLAELKYFENLSGEKPILLLDDVFSELDENRRQGLLDICRDVQTFITTAALNPQKISNAHFHRVENGNISF